MGRSNGNIGGRIGGRVGGRIGGRIGGRCQGLKEIDSIWVILKESKSWGEKEEERTLDTTGKRYTRRYHKRASKTSRFPQQQKSTDNNKYG